MTVTVTRVLQWFRPSRHRGFITLMVFLVLWDQISRHWVDNRLLLVGPIEVFRALVDSWREGTLQTDLKVSGEEFLKGFLPSVAFGLVLGMLLGTSKRIKGYLDPALDALNATPFIALAPLLILWFGIGTTKTIVLVFVLTFSPVATNTDTGIRSADPQLIDATRSFGASPLELFTKVRLPAALPLILTGVRIAIGRGLIGVVVGELFGSQQGVGYRILISSQVFATPLLLGGVVVFAIAGVLLVKLMQFIERKAAPWRAVQDGRLEAQGKAGRNARRKAREAAVAGRTRQPLDA